MIDQHAAAKGGGIDPCEEESVEKLAHFLSRRGVLDDLAMRRARRAQRQSGERFDLVLTRLGLIAEADLAGLVADFLGLPLVQLGELPAVPLLADRLQLPFLKSNRIIPVADRGDSLLVAVADPFNREAVAALSYLLGRPVECGVMAAGDIERALERLYGRGGAVVVEAPEGGPASEDDVRRLEDMASEAPVIRLVHDLITRAVEAQASDIHVEPREDSVRVRYRIDGVLATVETLPPALRAAVTSRIKIMANLNIAERRLPQDGRVKSTVRGKPIDLRISTMPTMLGESVVLRILDLHTNDRVAPANGHATSYAPYRSRVVWGPVVPQDRSRLVADERALVDAGIHSRRRAADELGVSDPDSEWRRWLEEESAIDG